MSDFLTLFRRLTRDKPYLHFCALMVVFKLCFVPTTQALGAMYAFLEMAAALSARLQASICFCIDHLSGNLPS